jgi:hypothetical protein
VTGDDPPRDRDRADIPDHARQPSAMTFDVPADLILHPIAARPPTSYIRGKE